MKASDVLKIDDEYTAFCIDEAVLLVANYLEMGHTPDFSCKESGLIEFLKGGL